MIDPELLRQAENSLSGLNQAAECIRSGIALSSPDEISRAIWRATDAIGELAKHFPGVCGTPESPTGLGYAITATPSDT